ncbi:MAG: hypothetical protein PWP65_213 [Clostridia bacterium]|nr:hypothetical protein [Clostridia bacterium]
MSLKIKALLFLLSIISISATSFSSNIDINPNPQQEIKVNKISETARLSSLTAWLKQEGNPVGSKDAITIGLITDTFNPRPQQLAYIEILAEEGFPFKLVSLKELASLSTDEIIGRFWALIFPEGLDLTNLAYIRKKLKNWIESRGGKILVIFDGSEQGEAGELIALAGLKFINHDGRPVVFAAPWIIPPASPLMRVIDPGVVNQNQIQVPGYSPYQSPHLYIETASEGVQLLATTISPQGKIIPLITAYTYPGNGAAFFINSPLGYLKATSNDDFLLRTILKYFLIDLARVPRLISAPRGIGGLVLNLHICAKPSLRFTKELLDSHAFTPDLPMSVCASAGPDNLIKGDRQGVDAAGKGKSILKKLEKYGSLGAHGGWNHAYWGLFFDKIPENEKQQLIDQNIATIAQISAKPVTEYAAPNGRHSPQINDYLARWGIEATAFPAAFNSPPTRAWFNERPDLRFWHFGYTSTRYGNCPENMLSAGCQPPQIVQAIREEVIDTAIKRREIRLFYTHADSLSRHPEIWEGIKNYLLEQKKAGRLTVRTMSDYASFLNRHQAVTFVFRRMDKGYELEATSPLSLRELTFALPIKENEYSIEADRNTWEFSQEKTWVYATIVKDVHQIKLRLRDGR